MTNEDMTLAVCSDHLSTISNSSSDTGGDKNNSKYSEILSPKHLLEDEDATADSLVQYLGHSADDFLPNVGGISIENSDHVQIGHRNIYRGPVTIKQIVYANGDPNIKTVDGVDNYGLQMDEYEEKENDQVGDSKQSSKKGFLWLQNVSKHRTLEIGVFIGLLLLFVVVLALVLILRHPPAGKSYINTEPDVIKPVDYRPDTSDSSDSGKLQLVSRGQWVAQPPINQTTPLVTPVSLVIIHHTATENCSSRSQCVFHVRYIQNFHIESNGWNDIGYNFLVGGDGAAYEGRGWTVQGAHTFGWNKKSIGIAFVGTFINIAPPKNQIAQCKLLIERGIELGYIKEDYKLLGARQFFTTESPGNILYEEIQKWPHWSKDLK